MNSIKKIGMIALFGLICCAAAYASDKTGISGLDQTLGSGQSTLKVIAKWGGIALLVIGGIMFGMGKLKGEALTMGSWIVFGLGLIIAGFGWWDTAFTYGFDLMVRHG